MGCTPRPAGGPGAAQQPCVAGTRDAGTGMAARAQPLSRRAARVTLAAAGNVGGQRSRWLVRRITSLTSELRQPASEYRTHLSRHLKPTPRAARLEQRAEEAADLRVRLELTER